MCGRRRGPCRRRSGSARRRGPTPPGTRSAGRWRAGTRARRWPPPRRAPGGRARGDAAGRAGLAARPRRRCAPIQRATGRCVTRGRSIAGPARPAPTFAPHGRRRGGREMDGRRLIVTGGAAVLALSSLVACEPPPPPQQGSVLIGCDRADERVQVTQTSHLDPDCTYTLGVDITASGVTLDCQGAIIRSAPGAGGARHPRRHAGRHAAARRDRPQLPRSRASSTACGSPATASAPCPRARSTRTGPPTSSSRTRRSAARAASASSSTATSRA